MSEERRIRIGLVGNKMSGKSNILYRFANQPFTNEYIPTLGLVFQTKQEDETHITLWDIGSNPRYQYYVNRKIQRCCLIGIVLDATTLETEEENINFSAWIDEIKKLNPNAQIFFLVNKMDLINEESQSYQNRINEKLTSVLGQKDLNPKKIAIHYCSAKDNTGIEEAFTAETEKFLAPQKAILVSRKEVVQIKPSLFSPFKTWLS